MNKIDLETAYIDPAKVFNDPQEVINTKTLTDDQKKKILTRWEYDAKQLQVADQENMPGPKSQMLKKVLDAKKHLEI